MTLSPETQRFHDIAGRLSLPSHAFIDGAYVPARSGRVFETLNPATAAVLGTVAHGDAADVDLAVAAARRSFKSK